MTTTGQQDLAGRLRLTPGAPPPHGLQSSRQDWAARLGHGVPATSLPGLMASLYNLCGHAHHLCSQLAIGAAAPGVLPAPEATGERLRRETAVEHIRRIGLDWPRLLSPRQAQAATAALREAALPRMLRPGEASDDPWPALTEWLRHALLQMPPAEWLAAWDAQGAAWLAGWCERHEGWLPRLLREARAADLAVPALEAGQALRPHADAASLCMLGATLALKPGFALRPQWNGACAHTGPWTRLRQARAEAPLSPWVLLGLRLAELVRLCLPGGDTWLGVGALCTGPRRGLAWVEMARGLLVHQVEVDPVSARVLACRVVAPTEWNFHPGGAVAQALAGLPPDAARATGQVHLLVAAFDPCVPFDIGRLDALASAARESGHA
ncbi:hypothetical protein [Hydrogenophaga sp.]|uniref:hypothetical protein n=1 Tax=Hydrogenophaga sp. TaxID=1904254 RepID=UPI00261A92BC|nr:hypothetical protein [Hydrogenophaga sp.]MCW5654890.1 hypothetical protein [Hydrogenophaga sp.]